MSQTRTATTSTPLHPLLADRWSPRAFDPAADLSAQQVTALLEAARWAPSAANSQPWRFLVAARGSEDFARIFDTLAAGNQAWAGAASALVVVAAATVDAAGNPAPWALYDTGQAVAHLSTQASHEGLSIHQMGGFDQSALASAFALDATLTPVVVLAIGVRSDVPALPEPFAARETAPRTRLPLEHLVLTAKTADATHAAAATHAA
jgi:nitroreductase